MKPQRRPLVAGLQQVAVNAEREKDFVFNSKPQPETPPAPTPPAESREGKGKTSGASRAPFTTRLRADFAHALQRASLTRKLEGKEPNTLQDILEEALEPWLRQHGYLS